MKVISLAGNHIDKNPPKKPLKVVWEGKKQKKEDGGSPTTAPPDPVQKSIPPADPASSLVHASLWQELKLVRQEREVLSSSIAPTVAKFEAEGLIIGTKILDPNAQGALRNLYNQIEARTREMTELYRQIEAAERGEKVVEQQTPANAEQDLYELKAMKRSIQNRRSKLKAKMSGGIKPKSPLKMQEWQMQLAQLDAEEHELNQKLNG